MLLSRRNARRALGVLVVLSAACVNTRVWPAETGALARVPSDQEVEFRFNAPRTLNVTSGATRSAMTGVRSLMGNVEAVRGDTAFVHVTMADNGQGMVVPQSAVTAAVPLD